MKSSDSKALSCRRDAFELPDDLHYLNGAYMSPLSKSVLAAGEAGLRRKAVPTYIQPSDFFSESDTARRLFGRLVNAPAEHIAIVPAVSYGIATVTGNLKLTASDNIVMLADQFPSNVYCWRTLASETGTELRTVHAPTKLPRGAAWNDAVMAAIDARTAVVAMPHVHWTDGTRFDLDAIGERARAVDAALIIDGTQSVGALPFDVERIQPDALIVHGYKWLMGPYGIGLAYYGPRFAGGRPIEQTWLGRAGAQDFSRLVDYQDDYGDGMQRFDMGGRASPIHVPMINAAMTEILADGVAARQAYCSRLIASIIERLESLGVATEPSAWRAAHLFGLHLPENADIRAIQARLAERGVIVSIRGPAVRVSPNVYNDARDMTALLDSLGDALA